MRVLFAIPILASLVISGAHAADPDGCDLAVDPTSSDAMVAALMPKSQQQVEACAARGIRFSTIAPGNAAPQAAPLAPNGFGALSLPILFATGSAEIKPAAQRIVDGLGKALTNPALKPYRFQIEGHTDTVGDPALNQDLSRRRAQTVTQYLVTHFQLDPHRLEPVGYGTDRLAVQTPPETAEAKNRRVQVVNIGKVE